MDHHPFKFGKLAEGAHFVDRDILDLVGEKVEWADPLFAIWLTHRYWTPGELRKIA